MFNIFRKKKPVELTDEEKSWNKLWELYDNGELDSIDHGIYCLCEYDSGVNGEGHSGFFCNSDNCDTLNDLISTLKTVLPESHRLNLMTAYEAYETDNEDDVCEKADDFFYDNEEDILKILQSFADNLE